jgi:hypothetical protein
MKKMKESKEQFIHCPEYRVVRYERGQSQHDGLYVDGFSICGIFCFQSKKGDRLSLIHANRFTGIETLLEEAKWVGECALCTLYSKMKTTLHSVTGKRFIIGVDCIPELQEKSKCQFKVETVDDKIIALLFKSDLTVVLLNSIEHHLSILYHPRLSQLDCIYKLNESFAYGKMLELKQETLVFNGTAWQKPQAHDLTLHPVATQILGNLGVNREYGFWLVLTKIREFAQSWLKAQVSLYAQDINFAVLATNPNAVIALTPFVQQYLLSNDSKLQFVTNVKAELNNLRDMLEQDDYKLRDAVNSAVNSADPAYEVSAVFAKANYQSEFRSSLYGIIMGFNGYYFHYQRAQLGTWQIEAEVETAPHSEKGLGINH